MTVFCAMFFHALIWMLLHLFQLHITHCRELDVKASIPCIPLCNECKVKLAYSRNLLLF